jgi:hypothetical protein
MSDAIITPFAPTGDPFSTRDIRLAACLMAVGIAPKGAEPVRVVTRADRPGESLQFFFDEASPDGRLITRELVAHWREGLDWIERNPEHPFAYVMAASMNHLCLLDYVKSASRQVYLRRGRSVAMLPLNASARLEEEILGQFQV